MCKEIPEEVNFSLSIYDINVDKMGVIIKQLC